MSKFARTSIQAALAIVLVVAAAPAYAHSGHGFAGGFVSGFLHPILGWDHVVAMVAVGLWGAFLGMPMMWILPVVFPLVMAVGGAMGVVGVPVPAVEMGIAASSLVLGLLIAAGARARVGLQLSSSALSPSSTGMRTARNCPTPPIRSPMPSVLFLRRALCTPSASRLGLRPACRKASLPCARWAG